MKIEWLKMFEKQKDNTRRRDFSQRVVAGDREVEARLVDRRRVTVERGHGRRTQQAGIEESEDIWTTKDQTYRWR